MTVPMWFVDSLSFCILCGCVVMRVPQIYNVIKAGSTDGLNLKSLSMEFWCFTVLVTYQTSMGYPLSGYLEAVALSIQDIILIMLVLKDRSMVTFQRLAIIGIYLTFLGSIMYGYLPKSIMSVLVLSLTPLSATSKILQLRTIIINKDPGHVSPLSWAIAVFAASGRAFTNTVLSGDMKLVLNASQAAILNVCVCAASTYYGRPKVKTN